jgi:hypothetical protein
LQPVSFPPEKLVNGAALSRLLALQGNINLASTRPLWYKNAVQAGSKQHSKSETQSLDNAIGNLVKVLKRDLQKKYGRVDYNQLRKDGFSNNLLTKIKQS